MGTRGEQAARGAIGEAGHTSAVIEGGGDQFAIAEAPEADAAILTGAGDHLAIGAKRDRAHGATVPLKRLDQLLVVESPDTDAHLATSGNILAVGAKGNAIDKASESAKLPSGPVVYRIPEVDSTIIASSRDQPTVSTKAQTVDKRAGQGIKDVYLIALNRADHNRAAPAAHRQQLAIRAKGNTFDGTAGDAQLPSHVAVARIPDSHRLIIAAGSHQPASGRKKDTAHAAGMPLERSHVAIVAQPPQPNRMVVIASSEQVAAGAKGHRADRATRGEHAQKRADRCLLVQRYRGTYDARRII